MYIAIACAVSIIVVPARWCLGFFATASESNGMPFSLRLLQWLSLAPGMLEGVMLFEPSLRNIHGDLHPARSRWRELGFVCFVTTNVLSFMLALTLLPWAITAAVSTTMMTLLISATGHTFYHHARRGYDRKYTPGASLCSSAQMDAGTYGQGYFDIAMQAIGEPTDATVGSAEETRVNSAMLEVPPGNNDIGLQQATLTHIEQLEADIPRPRDSQTIGRSSLRSRAEIREDRAKLLAEFGYEDYGEAENEFLLVLFLVISSAACITQAVLSVVYVNCLSRLPDSYKVDNLASLLTSFLVLVSFLLVLEAYVYTVRLLGLCTDHVPYACFSGCRGYRKLSAGKPWRRIRILPEVITVGLIAAAAITLVVPPIPKEVLAYDPKTQLSESLSITIFTLALFRVLYMLFVELGPRHKWWLLPLLDHLRSIHDQAR